MMKALTLFILFMLKTLMGQEFDELNLKKLKGKIVEKLEPIEFSSGVTWGLFVGSRFVTAMNLKFTDSICFVAYDTSDGDATMSQPFKIDKYRLIDSKPISNIKMKVLDSVLVLGFNRPICSKSWNSVLLSYSPKSSNFAIINEYKNRIIENILIDTKKFLVITQKVSFSLNYFYLLALIDIRNPPKLWKIEFDSMFGVYDYGLEFKLLSFYEVDSLTYRKLLIEQSEFMRR